ncbi:MAG TPA: cupin domain-containing protein [Chloroflexota bacterium]|nr:cupin domain-containing protein [Chloroflexota bacterium]
MTPPSIKETAPEIIHTPSGTGRRLNVLGTLAEIKVSSDQTGGAYAIWEDTVPPGGGPPPHVHQRENEDFYVLEGEFDIFRAEQPPLRAITGSYIHTPKGMLHTFKNVGSTTGRLLVLAVPGGMERFFDEIGHPIDPSVSAAPAMPPGPPPPEVIRHVIETAQRYGIEIRPPS